MIKINITTFPRSGRNFLRENLTKIPNVSVNAIHAKDKEFVLNKNKNYVGIIRNPYDSIISSYAMADFFNYKKTYKEKIDFGFKENLVDNMVKKGLFLNFNNAIEEVTNYYIEYYNYYLNNFDDILLLRFEDIINNMDLCLFEIVKKFNIVYDVKNHLITNNLQNNNKFLVSSKDTEWYEYAVKNINNDDQMEKANKIYNILLNKVSAL